MSEYIFPTAARDVSDSFSDHAARGSVNPGTDYKAGYGSAVVAVKAGRIVAADSTTSGSGGRLIYIDHPDGTKTDYLHLSAVQVSVGEQVAQGEQIGLSGASGYDQDRYYGPHLHISLHTGGGAAHGRNGGCVDFAAHVGGTGGGADPEVSIAQALLNNLGYSLDVDGVSGTKTKAAVKDYQSKHGLTPDGLIGAATLGSLHSNQPAPPPATGRASVSKGSKGQNVIDVQTRLNRDYPAYSDLVVDGDFGAGTDKVVREFQSRAGLEPDGIVGPATYAKLGL